MLGGPQAQPQGILSSCLAAVHGLGSLPQILKKHRDRSTVVDRIDQSGLPLRLGDVENRARRDVCDLHSGGRMLHTHDRRIQAIAGH